MPIELKQTRLQGVLTAHSTPIQDSRGAFMRAFCDTELAPVLGGAFIRQINMSKTCEPGTVRGLHFQHPPVAETKLIRCIRGRVWDVAVDLRKGSPTFLQWHSEELSPDQPKMLVIPAGCAHGFQVLEPDSEMLYLHTEPYTPSAEAGLRFDEPRLKITWPLPPTGISPRDLSAPLLNESYEGIEI